MPPLPPPEYFMQQALTLAAQARGDVEPNPLVGCVLVRAGTIIAQGKHEIFGGPHAEVNALRDAARQGIDPAGCDAYVTLEPCCHFGKTPPCAPALIQAGIKRVFVAMVDPFPQVAGQGILQLRAAGLDVQVGVCQTEAKILNEPFVKRVERGLPWVILKWAQTLDGRVATQARDSRWISGEESRLAVHQIRARVDALMVGIGTVLADDPLLTARHVPLHRTARRVVVDPNLRIPLESRLIQSLGQPPAAPPVTIAVRLELLQTRPAKLVELEARGIEIVGLPLLPPVPACPPPAAVEWPDAAPPRLLLGTPLDLQPLLAHLATAHQASNILVEAGPGLAGSLLQQKLADQILAFIAPKVLADHLALPCLTGSSIPALASAYPLRLHSVEQLGQDVLLDYRVLQPGSPDTRRS